MDFGGETDAGAGFVAHTGDGLEVGLGLVQVAHTHLERKMVVNQVTSGFFSKLSNININKLILCW